jgi:hypothetical protein
MERRNCNRDVTAAYRGCERIRATPFSRAMVEVGRSAIGNGRGHDDFGYDVRANFRLSRQIKVTEAPEGLLMATPERQA